MDKPTIVSARSYALNGITAEPVQINVDAEPGAPALRISGMSDRDTREARALLEAALAASGFAFPSAHIVVDLSRSASAFEPLAAAVALALVALERPMLAARLRAAVVVAALARDGAMVGARGSLAYLKAAEGDGTVEHLLLAARPVDPALMLLDGTAVSTAMSLAEAVAGLSAPAGARDGMAMPPIASTPPEAWGVELADVPLSEHEQLALAVAATGRHALLLADGLFDESPWPARLAIRLVGMLPPLTGAEAVEIATVRSVTGLPAPKRVDRPLRMPHPSIGRAGLLGDRVGPGEITLAHGGVLHLRDVEQLPADLVAETVWAARDGAVAHGPFAHRVAMPARCVVVATGGPNAMRTPAAEVFAVRARLDVGSGCRTGVTSAEMRERVVAARAVLEREQGRFSEPLRRVLLARSDGRPPHLVYAVARTCAALDDRNQVQERDIDQAVTLMPLPAEADGTA
jgi:magnesium chelatase family protein